MKMRLNEEEPVDEVTGEKKTGNVYGIELPIATCTPFSADFDGDCMVLHLVPPEVAEDTYNKMSPRYVNVYKKTDSPIFTPDQETLNGLALATEVKGSEDDLKDPKKFYDSYVEMLKDLEVNKTLDVNEPITFTGTVGSEKYVNKTTTPGRLRVSKILDADLDKVQDDYGNLICPWPKRITAKSGALLYRWLYPKPDGVEKMNELQKYGLHVVTYKGNVSFDFKTLYVDTNSETYDEIRKIVDNNDLTDKQKLLSVNSMYKKYCKEVQSRFDSDLKDELDRAARVKLTSIADINTPQLIISGVGEKVVVNHGSLYSGLSENEYRYHAVENRSLQSIKQSGVPSSGLG